MRDLSVCKKFSIIPNAFDCQCIIEITVMMVDDRGTSRENRSEWLFLLLISAEKKIGILPRWSPGSDGGTARRASQQDRVLDAGLHQRLSIPQGL